MESIRSQFPIFQKKVHGDKPLIYLDSAATTHKPKSVIDAMKEFQENDYGTVHRAVYSLSAEATKAYEQVREQVAQFIGANDRSEVVFTRGTTEGINCVAHSFGDAFLTAGDRIILTEMEHHANIVPWQALSTKKGLDLVYVKINELGELDLDHYRSLLNEKTKLVAVAHIANSTGTVNPVKTVIQLAHENGAKVLIDGAQSAPHLKIDVQDLDADFYLFSGHKMYGPTGIGILYGKKSLLDQMPPFLMGGDMIEKVTLEKSTFQPPPLRFEAGTPMITEVMGFGEAIEFIDEVGIDAIYDHEKELHDLTLRELRKIYGIRFIGDAREKGAIINFVIDGVHPLDLGTFLDMRGICVRTGHLCAQPTLAKFGEKASLRVSFGVYNTLDDVSYFIDQLKDLLKNPMFQKS